MPPRRAADVLHDLFCRFLHQPGFLSHLRSLKGYDEPEILPSSTRRICLIGADPGQAELRPLLLEHLPNGMLGTFRMWMSLGNLIGEPSIQLVIGLELQSRREEALANETHLVLDLTLLPARCRRAGDGLHQMMGAHLQEPPIILPVLADEDRLHRGLHIIIDATCAGAFKKGEGPLV